MRGKLCGNGGADVFYTDSARIQRTFFPSPPIKSSFTGRPSMILGNILSVCDRSAMTSIFFRPEPHFERGRVSKHWSTDYKFSCLFFSRGTTHAFVVFRMTSQGLGCNIRRNCCHPLEKYRWFSCHAPSVADGNKSETTKQCGRFSFELIHFASGNRNFFF